MTRILFYPERNLLVTTAKDGHITFSRVRGEPHFDSAGPGLVLTDPEEKALRRGLSRSEGDLSLVTGFTALGAKMPSMRPVRSQVRDEEDEELAGWNV